jgi:hypothetical protein
VSASYLFRFLSLTELNETASDWQSVIPSDSPGKSYFSTSLNHKFVVLNGSRSIIPIPQTSGSECRSTLL